MQMVSQNPSFLFVQGNHCTKKGALDYNDCYNNDGRKKYDFPQTWISEGEKQKLPGSRETGWLSMTLIFDIFGKKDWYEIKSSTKKAENSKTLRGKLN